MGLAERRAQAVRLAGHQDKMDVIGHQAVRPGLGAGLAAPLAPQAQIGLVIAPHEEDLHAADAPLGDVVRVPGNHQPRQARHPRSTPQGTNRHKKLYSVHR